MRHAIIAVLLLSALAGTAVAGQFEDAIAAFQRRDYAEAVHLYRHAAEQGHADAQYNLGHMYYWSEGVPQVCSGPQVAQPCRRTRGHDRG